MKSGSVNYMRRASQYELIAASMICHMYDDSTLSWSQPTSAMGDRPQRAMSVCYL